MANDVTTWIKVENGSPEVYQKLKVIFKDADNWEAWDSTRFYEALYPEHAGEDYDREKFTERMGAKWCYVQDFDLSDDEFELTTVSAWDWCRGAFERLHLLLHGVDENVILTCTFEDEGYNFVGGAAIKNVADLYEYSDDTLKYPDRDDYESEDEYDSALEKFYEDASESMNSCRDEAYDDATWDDEDEQFEE